MSVDPNSERRDYFRIEDRIGLELRRLSQDVAPGSDLFGDDHLDSLRSELRRLDLEVRNQLASLAERDRLLTTLIKALNGKVDTLARIMAFEQNPLQPQHWQEVTLSEGGLSFDADGTDLEVGDLVALRLTLPPELYRPQAVARVLEVAVSNTSGVRVHTEFTRIDDSARQQIARHVMRWQIRQRQQASDRLE